jgi:site-specific DNA recombinase
MLPNPQNTTKPQAVIYCRVSTKQQVDEGNSLSTQERLCREYALKQGYEVAAVYIEKGESAKTKDRTELQKMMSFCAIKKNNISYVVVYKLDRFSRNTDDYSYLRIILKRYGIYIKSTTEYFENTPAGRFMENIISNVSQFDNDVRTERAVNGSRDAMVDGRYVWIAPYGYDNIKIAGKGTIAPNQYAPILRQTFEEIAKNEYPVEVIRRKMFHIGLVSKKGTPVSRSHFYRMLRNEVYAGWIVKFGERHKGVFQQIISEELFEQVQKILKYRNRKNQTYQTIHPDFPLRRFVSHPDGMKLTGSWNQGKFKKYPYYRYLGHSMMNYPKDALEEQFKAFMDTYSLKEEHFEKLKKKLKYALENGLNSRQKDQINIRKKIADLKEKQGKLIEKNMSGFISNEIMRDQLQKIDNQLIDLNALLYKDPQLNVNLEHLVNDAELLIKNPSKIWEKANLENKMRIQVFNFPQGITFNGEIFQTPEICRLYKAKTLFLEIHSLSVLAKESFIKFPLEVANLPSINGDKSAPPNADNPNTEEYWMEVVEELKIAGEIVKNVQAIDSS